MYYKNSSYRNDMEEAVQGTIDFENLYGKTFFITGASGLIGSFLVDMLFYANETRNAGIQVYALVRDREGAQQRYRSFVDHPGFHLIVQDVCEPLLLEARADYVIHAAGDGYPKAFRERPVETMLPALTGTWRLLEYVKKERNSRFLYVSSGEIYGEADGKEGTVGEGMSGFTEADSGYVDTMRSRSCYPSAKRAAETLCAAYHAEYGVDAVVIRLSHIYGPNVSPRDNRASAQFFGNVLEGRDVILKSRGEQIRSYTYVADCVSAMLTVLIRGKAGEAYNVSNPDARASIAGFARMIAECGSRKCLFAVPNEEERQENTPIPCAVLNPEKLRQLGWQGAYDVSRGIRHTLRIMTSLTEKCEAAENSGNG